MPTKLLDLPAEVVQEIISLLLIFPNDIIMNPTYQNRQKRAQLVNEYTNLRSTCRSFKTFADTEARLNTFFPTHFQIAEDGSTIVPEDLNKLLSRNPGNFNKKRYYCPGPPPTMPDMAFLAANSGWRPPKMKIEQLPPKVWTEEEKDAFILYGPEPLNRFRLFSDGINRGLMPAMVITELHIGTIIPCPCYEWDTPAWKEMLTRLTKFHMSFQPLCKPKFPRIKTYPDLRKGWETNTNNESEDDDVANKRFELAQKQILSWPQYLNNVTHLGLQSIVLGEARYRGFFSNTNYMTKLVTIEVYLMLFGKEFLDFLEARKDTLRYLNLQMAGPMQELENAVEYPPGLDNDDLLYKDVHAVLARLNLIHYFPPVYDTDAAGLFRDEAEGYNALMAKIEENAKEVGYWRADIEHIQNCPRYIFLR